MSNHLVLITGATGFVGQRLVRRLCADGREQVRLLVRDERKARVFADLPVQISIGDLGDRDHVLAAAEGARIIYHLGGAKDGPWDTHDRGTVRGTAHVVEAALRQPGVHLVHVSSIAVYGIPDHSPSALTEDTPYTDEPVTCYARAKIAAEQIVRRAVAAQGLSATILRPGIIYGPETTSVSRLGLRVGRMFFLVGLRDTVLPLVEVDDVVEALLLAGRSGNGRGGIYHVVDHRLTKTGYLRRLNARSRTRYAYCFVPYAIAAAAGWTARWLRGCHRALAGLGETLSPLYLRSCVTDTTYDTTRITRDLGWTPSA